jgi:putative ABC transport system permease protein
MLADIRNALRVFKNAPGLAILIIVTLGLGIGANTAIFSVVSGVLLRPLPFANPDRLVQLNETFLPHGFGTVSYPTLQDWRAQSTSFESTIAYLSNSKNLQDNSSAERLAAISVDRDVFRVLGIEPIAGRTFRADDPPQVVVVSEGFWKRRYASDPALVGKNITLDGEPFTVIGIMPQSFQFPYRQSMTELWLPINVGPPLTGERGNHFLFVTARLKPGVTIDAARREMDVIAKRLEQQYPGNNAGRGVQITPLNEVVTGSIRSSLLLLLGAVGLVLLIACANVANLLLARAAGRTREVAIRIALGAGRARLIRQFLTESMILAIAGGLAGLLVSVWGTSLLVQLAAAQIPRSWEIGLDWRVFCFLAIVCVITGIGFGLAPALAATRQDVQPAMKESSGRGSAGRSQGLVRDALVVAEIALAFVLLIGAGLMMRAFYNLQHSSTGLSAENVLTLRMTLAESRYGSADASARHYHEIEERIAQIPGVSSVGFISLLPLQNWGNNGNLVIDGHPQDQSGNDPLVELRVVNPNYFRTMGIPILRGREFNAQDNKDSPEVALINDAAARAYFQNENPIGKKTNRGTIVGIVADVRQEGLDQPAAAELYQVLTQSPQISITLAVRSQLPPDTITGAVREAIRQVDSTQAIFNVKSMNRVIADSLQQWNLYSWLLGLFAGLALVLAMAGIYGVISYAVNARTQEFGIRLALGADGSRLLRLVLGHGSILIAIGLIVGAGGAVALTRLLKSLLADVSPLDPATFAVAAVLLAAIALLGCLVPARRAMRVDPMIALRAE